jgi:predicted O-methyltransferase YrrM
VIERLVRDGKVLARLDGSVHHLFPIAVSEVEGEALRNAVIDEGATRTIEIGLGCGLSALFIGEALVSGGDVDARHVALDPNQTTSFADCGLQLLNEAGLTEIVEFHAESSQTTLPRFLAEERTFDLAFVDGNHRFDGVFLDLVYLGQLVRPGGIVFIDDYQLPAVARAVSFCLTNLAWTLEQLSPPDDLHQWAVLRTPRVPDTRPFDFFIDF